MKPGEAGARELVEQAFRERMGGLVDEVLSIECLDEHLLGHAFKYRGAGSRLRGVFPYRIRYRSDGRLLEIRVMAKAKPDEAAIFEVYQGLLDQAGIRIGTPLPDLLRDSDYSCPNFREAILFRDFGERLAPFLPNSYGMVLDPTESYVLRLEEMLPAGSIILDPADDTTDQWIPGCAELVLRGIARMHARFQDRYDALLESGFVFVCDHAAMQRGRELWEAFHAFLCDHRLAAADDLRCHRKFLESVDQWYPLADEQPKALLYGDVNPQNLAFANIGGGRYELSLFDWERSVVANPLRGLAEFLVYVLPENAAEDEMEAAVRVYRAAFVEEGGVLLGEVQFRRGLVWMLRDLILNRLPLMQVVGHVAGKRTHSTAAYAQAHHLIRLLDA